MVFISSIVEDVGAGEEVHVDLVSKFGRQSCEEK